eukprot:NODE_579_length_1348_cov_179.519247_g540_i0.p1 GENE.NODE_579_length_1348_cov_179.519247_g540_i0~~NODE_579_length_1348_cov_179.519247_g540_i0.p1  ORF type:complete len:382 (+),score=37.45 NODE_579_length_1348_cov_179.519247_g540_i0:78-1223(+)
MPAATEAQCPPVGKAWSWQVENFVGHYQKQAEKCNCSICLGVPHHPVECANGHFLCTECMDEWMNTGQVWTCPECRTETKRARLGVVSRALFESLELICPHGCGTQVAVVGFSSHANECPDVVVSCPHSGCDTEIVRKGLTAHIDCCRHRVLPCALCGDPLPAHAMDGHVADECPKAAIPCGLCDADARGNLTEHRTSVCPRMLVPCPMPGCSVEVPREKLEHHVENAMATHMGALVQHVKDVKDAFDWQLHTALARQTAQLQQEYQAQLEQERVKMKAESDEAMGALRAELRAEMADTQTYVECQMRKSMLGAIDDVRAFSLGIGLPDKLTIGPLIRHVNTNIMGLASGCGYQPLISTPAQDAAEDEESDEEMPLFGLFD